MQIAADTHCDTNNQKFMQGLCPAAKERCTENTEKPFCEHLINLLCCVEDRSIHQNMCNYLQRHINSRSRPAGCVLSKKGWHSTFFISWLQVFPSPSICNNVEFLYCITCKNHLLIPAFWNNITNLSMWVTWSHDDISYSTRYWQFVNQNTVSNEILVDVFHCRIRQRLLAIISRIATAESIQGHFRACLLALMKFATLFLAASYCRVASLLCLCSAPLWMLLIYLW